MRKAGFSDGLFSYKGLDIAMARARLLLDTNILLDFLNKREPYYKDARKLLIAGRVGEFSLWVAASQLTDIVYIASDGGKPALIPQVLERLRLLRSFINVATISDVDVDKMLSTSWKDPEDALLFQVALKLRVDAIITRDANFPASEYVNSFTCSGFLEWLEHEQGVSYEEVLI